MRLCVDERMKYKFMGDKGMRCFIESRIELVRKEEKKERERKVRLKNRERVMREIDFGDGNDELLAA